MDEIPNNISQVLVDNIQEKILFCRANEENRTADILEYALIEYIETGNKAYLNAFSMLKFIPVTIDEFLESEEFLGSFVDVWAGLIDDVRELCPDYFDPNHQHIEEGLLGGATGIGKSFIMMISMSYNIYWYNCFQYPQLLYPQLNIATQFLVPLMAGHESTAKRVLYKPFRAWFDAMPFNRANVTWDKNNDSKLEIDNGIAVMPMIALKSSILGEAVPMGVVDEVNFMDVVEDSKKVKGGRDNKYDQALEMHNYLTRRRESRFATRGLNIGTVFFSSSANYQGDFLDRRIEKVESYPEEEKAAIFINKKKRYDVAPVIKEGTFLFQIGDDNRQPKILEHVEEADKGAVVEEVPNDFYKSFLDDPYGAQKEIIGVSAGFSGRYMSRVEKITTALKRGKKIPKLVDIYASDLNRDGMPSLLKKIKKGLNKKVPRTVHIDLSLTKDRCGIAMSSFKGVSTFKEGNLFMPMIQNDLAISLQPSKGTEVDIAAVRLWVIENLIHKLKLNIVKVTYDGFGSIESRQALKKAGVKQESLSMERTLEPYDVFRQAIYQERLHLCPHNHLLKDELLGLVYVKGGKKVDHQPTTTNDIADAVGGSVYSLTKLFMMKPSQFHHVIDDDVIEEMKQERVVKRRQVNRR